MLKVLIQPTVVNKYRLEIETPKSIKEGLSSTDYCLITDTGFSPPGEPAVTDEYESIKKSKFLELLNRYDLYLIS